MASTTLVPLCGVKGCPAPRDPDWHVPICGHGLVGSHHHVVKRSQGGKRGRQVFICVECHRMIDEGGWTLFVKEILGKEHIWATNRQGIEQWKNEGGSDGQPGTSVVVPDRDGPDAGINEHLGAPRAAAEKRPETPEAAKESKRDLAGDSAAAQAASGLSASEEAVLAVRPMPDATAHGGPSSVALSHEQKLEKAKAIRFMQTQRQWLAGDTAIEWINEMGESAWQYLDEFGYPHPTLSNIINICEKIRPPIRNEDLKWGFWQLIYSLNPEDVEMYRDWCLETKPKVRELREKLIEDGVREAKPEPKLTCPSCGHEAERSEF